MKTFLTAKWQNLIMVNYEVSPQVLKPYLPNGVELDYFEGKCLISLVGFLFKNTNIFKLPIPFLGSFEEVNLRFYVIRKEHGKNKRGVVFINETVPYKLVAWLANKLYKEHYVAIPTKHKWLVNEQFKNIMYQWKINKHWNSIEVEASSTKQNMQTGSAEEFIFEHYYGYTKVNALDTIEYKIHHPSWQINTIRNFKVNCNFEAFYGKDFSFLNNANPHSVMLAEGSAISVDWKRVRLEH